MTSHLLQRAVVPVANEDDAETTCAALGPYLEDEAVVIAVHVVEKAGGAPDKAPLEARREQARATFDVVEADLENVDCTVETRLRYGTDVVDEIVAAARAEDATAIAFTPRKSGRLTRLVTGDLTRSLVETDRIPVVVLPRVDTVD